MSNGDTLRMKQQIFAIISIIIVLFLSYKLLIPYYTYSQFKVDVQQVCNWDRENYLEAPPPDVLIYKILKAARQRNLPVNKSGISIRVESPIVRITVRYKVPIDLFFKTFNWEFVAQAQTQEIY